MIPISSNIPYFHYDTVPVTSLFITQCEYWICKYPSAVPDTLAENYSKQEKKKFSRGRCITLSAHFWTFIYIILPCVGKMLHRPRICSKTKKKKKHGEVDGTNRYPSKVKGHDYSLDTNAWKFGRLYIQYQGRKAKSFLGWRDFPKRLRSDEENCLKNAPGGYGEEKGQKNVRGEVRAIRWGQQPWRRLSTYGLSSFWTSYRCFLTVHSWFSSKMTTIVWVWSCSVKSNGLSFRFKFSLVPWPQMLRRNRQETKRRLEINLCIKTKNEYINKNKREEERERYFYIVLL